MSITISRNGPYVVTGLPLSRQAIRSNAADESIEWLPLETIPTPDRYFLCRCGQSANKPYCDGSHTRVGFDGTKTASREPYVAQATVVDGPALTMLDAAALCAFARFCDRDGKVWNTVGSAATGPSRDALVSQIGQCPSGRLTARDKATDRVVEPQLEPQVVLLEDPLEQCSGPIFVGGGVEIVGEDGIPWERRNRVTLCRCGESKNKPFCDGTHATVKFKDESSPLA
jgi:CDGSH-type Zn-finger protein